MADKKDVYCIGMHMHRHEAHLDNLGMEGGSFGSVPFMELFMDDYAAGIRPADGGTNSFLCIGAHDSRTLARS